MKFPRKLLKAKQCQYIEYNLQDEFLHRPINIFLGSCRVDPILNPGTKAYLHLCAMALSIVGDLSLHGTMGAEMKEFTHSFLSE